jgi:hypothetical protein
MNTPRRQHYVWRRYLLPWSTDEKIWCLRGTHIFNPNLINVAVESDFYKINDMTDEEVVNLKRFCDKQSGVLRDLNHKWIDLFRRVFDTYRELVAKGLPSSVLAEQLEKARTSFEEKIHGIIERDMQKYLEALLIGDVSFYSSHDDRALFLHFFCVQYTRTNRAKSRAMAMQEKENTHGYRIDNIWNVLCHIVATSMAANLLRKDFELYLLKNQTEEAFIAGDQPAINPHATYLTDPADYPKKQEYFYPISPSLAVLISLEPPNDSVLSLDEVRYYNKHMELQSHTQLFAHGKDALEKIRAERMEPK